MEWISETFAPHYQQVLSMMTIKTVIMGSVLAALVIALIFLLRAIPWGEWAYRALSFAWFFEGPMEMTVKNFILRFLSVAWALFLIFFATAVLFAAPLYLLVETSLWWLGLSIYVVEGLVIWVYGMFMDDE